ncbi:MAG TPA: hypothetical protein VFR28_08480 [Allosphingosinicella sp.]|nr:hypothetical protein [Allosphingosinicella sp.]
MAVAAALATAFIGLAAPAQAQSDSAIRQKIVRASIDSYPGSCPCPYNTDRAGRSCGRRSAYSRPGGYAPKCYPADVTAAEVKAYRAAR